MPARLVAPFIFRVQDDATDVCGGLCPAPRQDHPTLTDEMGTSTKKEHVSCYAVLGRVASCVLLMSS